MKFGISVALNAAQADINMEVRWEFCLEILLDLDTCHGIYWWPPPPLHAIRFMTDAARREQETMKKKATPKLSLSITGGVSRNSTATPPRHTSGNLTPPVTPPITPSSSFRSSTPTGMTGVKCMFETKRDKLLTVVKLSLLPLTEKAYIYSCTIRGPFIKFKQCSEVQMKVFVT